MKTIKVKEPQTGFLNELKVHPVYNFTFPGWVVFIPEQRNVLLYLRDNKWETIPETISSTYAQRIGKKLR